VEDGIYIPRAHFDQLLRELDEMLLLVDAIVRIRPALVAARQRIRENDPELTPVQIHNRPPAGMVSG
jgi:hypothetical protein